MNILMLNAQNPFIESVIPLDLLNGFKERGHNVKLLVNSYNRFYPKDIVSIQPFHIYFYRKLKEKIKIRTRLGLKTPSRGKYVIHCDEQKLFYNTNKILKKAKFKPDAIIIFFAQNFITSQNINELYKKTNAPIYWLMYDMAPLTGGCDYAWDCKGYQNSCGCCPALHSSNPLDITFKNLLNKKSNLDKVNINIVAGSEYLYRQTKASSVFKNHKIYKNLTSFDSNIFKQVPKAGLREKSGISNNKKVIFFGAARIFEERKGMQYLIDALEILKDLLSAKPHIENEILLLVAGRGFDKIKDLLPFEHLYLGFLDNTYGIASAFQMADIFVCSSIEDSGPTMINQSIMCGTPVASFEMGVAMDLVITGQTGYRAKLEDSHDLALGIYTLLNMPPSEDENMRNNCRKLALELYSPSTNIDKWLEILGNSR